MHQRCIKHFHFLSSCSVDKSVHWEGKQEDVSHVQRSGGSGGPKQNPVLSSYSREEPKDTGAINRGNESLKPICLKSSYLLVGSVGITGVGLVMTQYSLKKKGKKAKIVQSTGKFNDSVMEVPDATWCCLIPTIFLPHIGFLCWSVCVQGGALIQKTIPVV